MTSMGRVWVRRQRNANDLIDEFRASNGKLSGKFAGTPVLLLTTTGARTGKPHTVVLSYTTCGDDLIVVASNGGAEVHPDWYYNLLADPSAVVEIGRETFTATATDSADVDRTHLLTKHTNAIVGFSRYRDRTTRAFPVLRLSLREAPSKQISTENRDR